MVRVGELLLKQTQQHQQSWPEFRLECRFHIAEYRVAVHLDRHALRRTCLFPFDDLEQEDDAFIELRVVGEQPLGFAIAQVRCVGRAGDPVLRVGDDVGTAVSAYAPACDVEWRRAAGAAPRLAQGDDDFFHRWLVFRALHHGGVAFRVGNARSLTRKLSTAG